MGEVELLVGQRWPTREAQLLQGRRHALGEEALGVLPRLPLIENAITGDDDPLPITERAAPIARVAGEAAASDPELAAMMETVNSPQVADMLMSDHGWSPKRYEGWLARMILATVIQTP